jgi:nucleoid-associated protein YgaU
VLLSRNIKGDFAMADINAINQAVQGAGSTGGVRNLSVQQSGNQFEIHGQADNIAAKQQAFRSITDKVGDTAGLVNLIQVASDSAQQPSIGGSTPASGGARTHTVKHGETLTGIAQKYYGKASEFNKIFNANRDKLSDPDKIREGTTLIIPA